MNIKPLCQGAVTVFSGHFYNNYSYYSFVLQAKIFICSFMQTVNAVFYLDCPPRHCLIWATNSSSQNTSSAARCLRTVLEQVKPQI